MAFRFEIVRFTADTPEELEMVRKAMSDYFGDDNSKKKTAKTRSEINREYYERTKAKSEKSEIQTEKSENGLKKSEIQSESKEKEEKEKSTKKEKEEKEILINTSANAEVQTAKIQTAEAKTPDDPSFWGFARENAKLAEAFYCETGIAPVKKEFGRWVNDLRDLAEAGITIQGIRDTVAYMRSKNLPIGAPGSLLKTARWLKTNPQKQPQTRSPSASERWDKAEAELQSRFADDIFGMLPEMTNGTEIIDI